MNYAFFRVNCRAAVLSTPFASTRTIEMIISTTASKVHHYDHIYIDILRRAHSIFESCIANCRSVPNFDSPYSPCHLLIKFTRNICWHCTIRPQALKLHLFESEFIPNAVLYFIQTFNLRFKFNMKIDRTFGKIDEWMDFNSIRSSFPFRWFQIYGNNWWFKCRFKTRTSP